MAKRDFGSFHSSNVEELLAQSDTDYVAPDTIIKFDSSSLRRLLGDSEFGTSRIKEELFCLTDEFCFLNHGAFGLTFKPTLDFVHAWKCHAESQPLRFYDRQVMPLMVHITRRFATLLGCKPTELTLVENCTFAFNSVLNSIRLEPGDKILMFSSTYGVYKKILKYKCEQARAVLIEQTIEFPIVDENDLNAKTVSKLEKWLKEDNRIKCVLVDHIPSNQPFLMPVKEMAALPRRPDTLFIVDAAHTLGSFKNFNFNEYFANVDLLFTNCHKWFCGPKGTGLLYQRECVKDKLDLKSAVLSHGFLSGFNSDFIWSGLKDYSAYMGLYSNLELWSILNDHGAIEYCTNLARKAAEYLKDEWKTSLLVDSALCSTMLCVQLPSNFLDKLFNESNQKASLNYDQAEHVQNFLYFKHSIEVPIKAVQNKLYVRISAHVYNNLEDYKRLANAVTNC